MRCSQSRAAVRAGQVPADPDEGYGRMLEGPWSTCQRLLPHNADGRGTGWGQPRCPAGV